MNTKIHITAFLFLVIIIMAYVPAMAEQNGTGSKTESVVPADPGQERLPQIGSAEGGMEFKASGNMSAPGRERFKEIYTAVKSTGTCLGAVGAAFCGIEYIKGGDTEAERAIKRLIIILTAVAALNLVPLAAGFGAELASGIRWEPPEISSISIAGRT